MSKFFSCNPISLWHSKRYLHSGTSTEVFVRRTPAIHEWDNNYILTILIQLKFIKLDCYIYLFLYYFNPLFVYIGNLNLSESKIRVELVKSRKTGTSLINSNTKQKESYFTQMSLWVKCPSNTIYFILL